MLNEIINELGYTPATVATTDNEQEFLDMTDNNFDPNHSNLTDEELAFMNDLDNDYIEDECPEVAITYGRFRQIHLGHTSVFDTVLELGTTEAIIASNQCDFNHLRSVYEGTYTTIRHNNLFRLVEDVIDTYGPDVVIYLVLGSDQAGFARRVQEYYPENVIVRVIERTENAPSSTAVRLAYSESNDLREFTERVLEEGLVNCDRWAHELYTIQSVERVLAEGLASGNRRVSNIT